MKKRNPKKIKVRYLDQYFEWLPEAARKSIEEQNIGFDEALTAFEDPNLLQKWQLYETPPSFTITGMSKLQRLLLVSGDYKNNATQIFSVKEANEEEKQIYLDVNAKREAAAKTPFFSGDLASTIIYIATAPQKPYSFWTTSVIKNDRGEGDTICFTKTGIQ